MKNIFDVLVVNTGSKFLYLFPVSTHVSWIVNALVNIAIIEESSQNCLATDFFRESWCIHTWDRTERYL